MSRLPLTFIAALGLCAAACAADESASRIYVKLNAEGPMVPLVISTLFEAPTDRPPRELFVRLNGSDAWTDESRVSLDDGPGSRFLYVPAGDYELELVEENGKVVVSTAPLKVQKNVVGVLLVYGPTDEPQHTFISRNSDSVPEGKVRYAVGNIAHKGEAGRLELCLRTWPSETYSCKTVRDRVEYGEFVDVDLDQHNLQEQSIRTTLLDSGRVTSIVWGPFPPRSHSSRAGKVFMEFGVLGPTSCAACNAVVSVDDTYWFEPWE